MASEKPSLAAEENQGDPLEGCICWATAEAGNLTGYSVCGIVCPVHYNIVIKKLRARVEEGDRLHSMLSRLVAFLAIEFELNTKPGENACEMAARVLREQKVRLAELDSDLVNAESRLKSNLDGWVDCKHALEASEKARRELAEAAGGVVRLVDDGQLIEREPSHVGPLMVDGFRAALAASDALDKGENHPPSGGSSAET